MITRVIMLQLKRKIQPSILTKREKISQALKDYHDCTIKNLCSKNNKN